MELPRSYSSLCLRCMSNDSRLLSSPILKFGNLSISFLSEYLGSIIAHRFAALRETKENAMLYD